MSDLIYREDAKDFVRQALSEGYDIIKYLDEVPAVDCPASAAAPTVDAVPVVRCRDCIHYEMGACLKIYDDGALNKDAWQERNPNDYCSYGECKPTRCKDCKWWNRNTCSLGARGCKEKMSDGFNNASY